MPRCLDCGQEDVDYNLINGFCEDCIEFHIAPEWLDEDGNLYSYDPVNNFLQRE